MIQEFYATKNKDDEIRMISSSGGMFLAFASEILKHNGIVYGAVYDDDLNVIHIGVNDYKDLKK